MRILLINPPDKNIISSEAPLFVRQNEGVFPPLGLMYIASYLKQYCSGCDIKILDSIAEGMGYDTIEKYIYSFHPDIVGITTQTHRLIDVILTAGIVKNVDKNIRICLGGPHVDTFPKETMSIANIDYGILGEGETTFAELVRSSIKKSDIDKISGLVFRCNGDYINTGTRENIQDIDSLPFPDRSELNYGMYHSILGRRSIMSTMISSRGCPYQCTFCSTPRGYHRMRSPENVAEEMEQCAKLGIGEIHFVDDTFNAYPERVIGICDEIKKRRLIIKWSFRGRIDKINEPFLKYVKRAGCFRINLGVETSTDEGLRNLKKGILVKQIRQVFKWTRSIGISTVAYFLIGCPQDKNKEDVIRTIDFSKDINPDFALFNILTPYPATELYEEGLNRGILKKDYWREFAINPRRDFEPQHWQEWLSKKELFDLLNLAYRRFYLRPKFLIRMLRSPQDFKIFIKKIKAGLDIIKL